MHCTGGGGLPSHLAGHTHRSSRATFFHRQAVSTAFMPILSPTTTFSIPLYTCFAQTYLHHAHRKRQTYAGEPPNRGCSVTHGGVVNNFTTDKFY